MNKVNLSTSFDTLEEQEKKFPNRHKEIHKGCCKNCPSNNNLKQGITDFESEEIKTYPKDLIIKEFLFVCAWRPNKLCKGLCDYHEIDEKLIGKYHERNNNNK